MMNLPHMREEVGIMKKRFVKRYITLLYKLAKAVKVVIDIAKNLMDLV